MNSSEADQKEHHRLGTMGKWDPPEADWAAEYDWTRYRGPDPWPVPGGWVFGDPEGGGWWKHFADAGVGHHKDDTIRDELKADESTDDAYDRMDELREENGEYASLTVETANPDEVSMLNPRAEKLEWTLEVDGAQVFRRVEPDRSDLMGAVAEALDAHHNGREDRFEEIVPATGRKPDDVLEQEKHERREEENESLDEFATDGGQSGLFQKYEVYEDGEPVEDCFVLEPGSDRAARHALSEYARRTEDKELANELRHWVDEIEGQQSGDSDE